MLRTLFHVSPPGYSIGDHITHGRYGLAARQFHAGFTAIGGPNLGALMWEVALETARQAVAPEAVSRLDCLFACEALDHARAFRDQFRPASVVYEIEPWPDAKLFRGNYDFISANVSDGSFVDVMPPVAIRYWTELPGGQVEVLIGGPADVCRVYQGRRPQ